MCQRTRNGGGVDFAASQRGSRNALWRSGLAGSNGQTTEAGVHLAAAWPSQEALNWTFPRFFRMLMAGIPPFILNPVSRIEPSS